MGQEAVVRLRLPPGSQYHAPLLLIYEADRYEHPAAAVGLEPQEEGGDGLLLAARFSVPWPGLYFYCFQLTLNGRRQRILCSHSGEGVPGPDEPEGGLWQLTVYEEGFATPSFLKGGVMYQIFPDRFYSSGARKQGVPKERQLRPDWGGLPKYLPDDDGVYRPNDYFGGDLAGIREKLPYLASLGVTCLYLNPIFEAHSNHRYNTADYCAVDPLLGSEEDFSALCRAGKELGISVVLDGVFSHTGSDSVYFNREGRYPGLGAYQSLQSPYAGWYNFYGFPDQYDSWWGFNTLPNVNECAPDYLEFICGPGGVLAKWLGLGAAGWRLDVADELPDGFLDRLRLAVKRENPDGLVLGEVWEDASNKSAYSRRRRYLLGQQLDSVMNYPFRSAILDFARYGDGPLFFRRVLTILEHYPKPVVDCMMNLLSTHDVERAITMLAAPPMEGRDRRWQARHHYLSEEQYRMGLVRLRLAALLQYTLPGLPSLYYGDEAGLSGYRDPFNRACYPWGHENAPLVEFFQALGQFRRAQPLFAEGAFLPLEPGASHCAYLRHDAGRAVYVAVNAGNGPVALRLPPGFKPEGEPFQVGSWANGQLEGRSGLLWAGAYSPS